MNSKKFLLLACLLFPCLPTKASSDTDGLAKQLIGCSGFNKIVANLTENEARKNELRAAANLLWAMSTTLVSEDRAKEMAPKIYEEIGNELFAAGKDQDRQKMVQYILNKTKACTDTLKSVDSVQRNIQ